MISAMAVVVAARSYLGVREVPDGSNSGPSVSKFQSSTGAYRLPWCVSFQQYCIKSTLGYTIADATAGVFYLVSWGRKHGYLRPVAEPGLLVAFLNGAGHIGIVESVTGDSMTTIEGNHNNSVARVTRPSRGNYAFVQIPGTSTTPPPKPKPKLVPRFELVTSEKGHTVVLARWGTWKIVSAKIPQLVANKRAFQIKRKLVKG